MFLAVVGLFAWSVTSPLVDHAPRWGSLAFGLIALSASVRLAGQFLAINTVGALCLVYDVYALGLLLGLGSRARLISPAWLAVVFAFSLPLERIVQRTIGHMLQQVSAKRACGVLETVYDAVTCEGVRIVLAGKDVLVDLPCSGARALLLTLLAFAGAAATCRPAPLQFAAGFLIALVLARAANILRITVLAIGFAEPWRLGGIAVMEQPWHDLIGLATLAALACAPLLTWAKRVWRRDASYQATFQAIAGGLHRLRHSAGFPPAWRPSPVRRRSSIYQARPSMSRSATWRYRSPSPSRGLRTSPSRLSRASRPSSPRLADRRSRA